MLEVNFRLWIVQRWKMFSDIVDPDNNFVNKFQCFFMPLRYSEGSRTYLDYIRSYP